MDSSQNAKPVLKCFCGKDMQYDQETGVYGCDDSVYVPPDAKFEDGDRLDRILEKIPHSVLLLMLASVTIILGMLIEWRLRIFP